MINSNSRGRIGGAGTRKSAALPLPPGTQDASAIVRRITLAAALAPRNSVSFSRRRPNPAVKRTYPGVAALRSHRAPSAPVYAAYLRR